MNPIIGLGGGTNIFTLDGRIRLPELPGFLIALFVAQIVRPIN